MTEVAKETQYQRKKRLAAEKAAREAAAASTNPFAGNAESLAEQTINESYEGESYADEPETTQEAPALVTESADGSTTFAMPEADFEGGDWLSNIDNTQVVAQVSESVGYTPISEDGIFSLNYKDSNIIAIRPYPIMTGPNTSISVFSSISTLINDPSGEGEPIFNEISPRVSGGRDEVLQKMLGALKNDPDLKRATVRTIDNKFMLCQIISNKNNPETVGQFVLFRISYSLSKILEEQGVYASLSDLVMPSNTRAIVVNMTYDESRAKRIEYNVSVQSYAQGQDKLVKTATNAFVNVGSDLNAFKAWKIQFYAAFKTLKDTVDKLLTCDASKFTPIAAEAVWAKFKARYDEVNAAMTTSAGTAAAAIAQGQMPQLQVANPFGGAAAPQAANPFGGTATPQAANPFGSAAAPQAANPFGGTASTPTANPFVGNMGGGQPANPFGGASTPGGFSDMQ